VVKRPHTILAFNWTEYSHETPVRTARALNEVSTQTSKIQSNTSYPTTTFGQLLFLASVINDKNDFPEILLYTGRPTANI
jgi:hypothetical protein